MVKVASITEYTQSLVNAFKKVDLKEFMMKVKSIIHPEMDMSFMDYFLELSKEENDGQFIVHHDKLIEYGVTSSNQSANIKQRLKSLGCMDKTDFNLIKFNEVRNMRGNVEKNVYMLTPEAFKKCLMRATKHSTHTINVEIYANYYLFLEKVIAYYTKYQYELSEAFSRCKDDRIDALLESNKGLLQELNSIKGDTQKIISQNTNLSDQVDDLSEQVEDVRNQLSKANLRIESFVGMIANLAFTPKITKDLIQLYSNEDGIIFEHNKPWNGIDEVKMFFIFGWINTDHNEITMQVACRNFAQTTKRIMEIVNRMNTSNGTFIGCKAIAIVDKDVNEEKKLIDNVFGTTISNKATFKRFGQQVDGLTDAQETFARYVQQLHSAFRMRHQQNIVEVIRNEGENANGKAAKSIENHFLSFNAEALGWCQEFIDAYIIVNDDRVSVANLRTMSKDYTVDGVVAQQGNLIRMNRCAYAKVQLKACVRNFDQSMSDFIDNLSDDSCEDELSEEEES